ncbi:MAG: YcgN family cysteine cluster protein [Alphaproteobacteria bacterium]|nr:MAG: YcgN family cysteine cluster protein [Alphaproteobacteria bacterium]
MHSIQSHHSQPEFIKKPLHEMTHEEWESLCDGCGLCCQIRIEDGRTGKMHFSPVACRLLCLSSHQCKDYPNRKAHVSDCVRITPENIYQLSWLPHSCAYKLVAYGNDLPQWHHLVCGDRERVHQQGISMRGRTISEDEVQWSDYGVLS